MEKINKLSVVELSDDKCVQIAGGSSILWLYPLIGPFWLIDLYAVPGVLTPSNSGSPSSSGSYYNSGSVTESE